MFKYATSSLSIALLGVLLSGCASLSSEILSDDWSSNAPNGQELLLEVNSYPATVAIDQRVDFAALKQITPKMREDVRGLFKDWTDILELPAAGRVAKWMVDPDGLAMQYDIDANFSPVQAYAQKRANCLSFTLLLRALVAELGIEIQINEVDIPANWGMNYEENVVFYRHVNGIRLRGPRRQVFDLALDQFRFDYPQRRISEQHAYAQLISNTAIDALNVEDYPLAKHLIKTALSTYSRDPNFWVNFGVITERLGDVNKAAAIYRLALDIDDSTLVAITNLARVYEQFGMLEESSELQKRATKIRSHNPYHHYFLAKEYLDGGDSRLARRHINKALAMHNEDARFYELRSRTWQLSNRYSKALRDMEKAYAMSLEPGERFHFKNKAVRIARELYQSDKSNQDRTQRSIQDLNMMLRTQ
jgi:tetratricopeptide (TPR) repeat protein